MKRLALTLVALAITAAAAMAQTTTGANITQLEKDIKLQEDLVLDM